MMGTITRCDTSPLGKERDMLRIFTFLVAFPRFPIRRSAVSVMH
jgi:hypothetical protein